MINTIFQFEFDIFLENIVWLRSLDVTTKSSFKLLVASMAHNGTWGFWLFITLILCL